MQGQAYALHVPSLSDSPTLTLDDVKSTLLAATLSTFSTVATVMWARKSSLPWWRRLALAGAGAARGSFVAALTTRIDENNAFHIWTVADSLTLLALASAAKAVALRQPEPRHTSAADGVALRPGAGVRWRRGGRVRGHPRRWQSPLLSEDSLLAVLRHFRFARMSRDYLQSVVRAWPPMQTKEGLALLMDAIMPSLDGGTLPSLPAAEVPRADRVGRSPFECGDHHRVRVGAEFGHLGSVSLLNIRSLLRLTLYIVYGPECAVDEKRSVCTECMHKHMLMRQAHITWRAHASVDMDTRVRAGRPA